MKKGKQQQRKKQFVSFALAILLVMGLLQTGTTGESSFLKKFFQLDVLTMAYGSDLGSGSGSGSTPAPDPAPTPSVPVTVYYSVHYVIDGSEAMGGENGGNTTTCESGSTMGLREPEKEGKIFDGWYLTPDYSPSSKVTSITVNSDMTVYGRWSYPIHCYVDGEAVEDEAYPKQYFPEEEVQTLPDGPEREGLLFEGWYQDEALTTPVLQPAVAATDQEEKNFYAKYTLSKVSGDQIKVKSYEVYHTTKWNLKKTLASYWKEGDTYTFSSLDDKIATVDEEGTVRPVADGRTEIRVMRNGHYCFDVRVSVKPVKGKLNQHAITTEYEKDKTYTLSAKDVGPSNGKITFKSSNAKIVQIQKKESGKCNVIIKDIGTAKVFLYVNGKRMDTCEVRVKKKDPKLSFKSKEVNISRRKLKKGYTFTIRYKCLRPVHCEVGKKKYRVYFSLIRSKKVIIVKVNKKVKRGKYIIKISTASSKYYKKVSKNFVIRIR